MGPPLIADGKIFLGDEDGDVRVFALSPQLKLLAKTHAGAVYSTPARPAMCAYISTPNHLFAIAEEGK